jgi:Ni/Fe-hydrogenase subunit HybB-like protein
MKVSPMGETNLTYSEVDGDILAGLRPPRPRYLGIVFFLAMGIGLLLISWTYQVHYGMGLAGISHPVGWAVYIANFVFWVGIAHSGTLISAILHLVRSRWRTAVSRSAEAMTIFAIMTAGLFPLVHLGRLWVFWYILPYPSERQLWPNFTSPLVWDVLAVSTYFTVSLIFFYVGLIPDLASIRDRLSATLGPNNLRARFYRRLALGWTGSHTQWRHYGRSYLYFAALATPLVISVHSVVSWDFAMSILPGWHTTIFAPYFVAGAIHSGLAMVLVLLIPMRKFLRLERVIHLDQFEAVALTMIVTGLIVGYAYVVEPFISWYSGDLFEKQFTVWRASGFLAVPFWLLIPLNVLAPLAFLLRPLRRNYVSLFILAFLVVAGMWLERYMIVPAATAHDFMPHNWGAYFPKWVEICITIGSFCFFLFWFFLFSKLFPTVAVADVKEEIAERQIKDLRVPLPAGQGHVSRRAPSGILAVFPAANSVLCGLRTVREARFDRVEVFSPLRLDSAEKLLEFETSPVRYWTLFGALAGAAGGFALAIGSALVNGLIVGGKHPVSIIPFCIPGFEGTVLLGSIANLVGLIIYCRLGRPLPAVYDPRFSLDRFGLFVACGPGDFAEVKNVLSRVEPEEVHEYK